MKNYIKLAVNALSICKIYATLKLNKINAKFFRGSWFGDSLAGGGRGWGSWVRGR